MSAKTKLCHSPRTKCGTVRRGNLKGWTVCNTPPAGYHKGKKGKKRGAHRARRRGRKTAAGRKRNRHGQFK